MRNLPVHWSEGMFLRPHHLQALDRHWAEALATSGNWDNEYNYGLRHVEISPEAIANYHFQLNVCHARLRDGMLVSLEAGQEPDRADLKEPLDQLKSAMVDLSDAFAQESTIRVFLAVPKMKLGAVNVGNEAGGGKHRFTETIQSLQDENQGGNDQEIQLRALNARLLLSTQDLSGYELLPIAQIQRASEEEAAPRIDPQYIPPVLAIDAWPPLGRDIVRAIYDIIGKKIEILGEQVVNRGITFESQEPGDLNRLFMLSQLNSAYTTLGTMAFARGVHPLVAYTELCRIVGQLSVFAKERRPPPLLRYDHDDLGTIFLDVKQKIEALINTVRDYEYEQRFFVGVGLGMQVTLEQKWLGSDWQWYIGVAKGDLTEKDCRELLTPGQLDWKLGAANKVEILFKTRAQGVSLVPVERPPRPLPTGRNWIYYSLAKQGAPWRDVHETQTLAMRLKDILIVNRDQLQDQRTLIVAAHGKHAVLQFALFAVPTQQ